MIGLPSLPAFGPLSGPFPLGLLALVVRHLPFRALAGAPVKTSRPWAISGRTIRARFAALDPALGRCPKATRPLCRGWRG